MKNLNIQVKFPYLKIKTESLFKGLIKIDIMCFNDSSKLSQ